MSSKRRFEIGKYYINPHTKSMLRMLITKVDDEHIIYKLSVDNYTKLYSTRITLVSPDWVELTDELKAELL